MNIIESIIEEAADTAEKQEQSFENCHKDSEGYFVCNVCGKRKQFRFRDRLVPAQCDCDQERERRIIAELKQEPRIAYLFETGVTDRRYLRNTFEKDDGLNPEISAKCQKYVEHRKEMKKNNIGILSPAGAFKGNIQQLFSRFKPLSPCFIHFISWILLDFKVF